MWKSTKELFTNLQSAGFRHGPIFNAVLKKKTSLKQLVRIFEFFLMFSSSLCSKDSHTVTGSPGTDLLWLWSENSQFLMLGRPWENYFFFFLVISEQKNRQWWELNEVVLDVDAGGRVLCGGLKRSQPPSPFHSGPHLQIEGEKMH